jgi:hypothetical protein
MLLTFCIFPHAWIDKLGVLPHPNASAGSGNANTTIFSQKKHVVL